MQLHCRITDACRLALHGAGSASASNDSSLQELRGHRSELEHPLSERARAARMAGQICTACFVEGLPSAFCRVCHLSQCSKHSVQQLKAECLTQPIRQLLGRLSRLPLLLFPPRPACRLRLLFRSLFASRTLWLVPRLTAVLWLGDGGRLWRCSSWQAGGRGCPCDACQLLLQVQPASRPMLIKQAARESLGSQTPICSERPPK